eukprot:5395636-Amphidinium_carterae.1
MPRSAGWFDLPSCMRSALAGARVCGPTFLMKSGSSMSRRHGCGPRSCLGNFQTSKVSHVAWLCVLTFEANQGTVGPEAPPALVPK